MKANESNHRKRSGNASATDQHRLVADGGQESDEWNPQPAQLRDGEQPDVGAHTRANLAAIKEQERRGHFDEGTFERAAERHGVDPAEVPDYDDDDHDLVEEVP